MDYSFLSNNMQNSYPCNTSIINVFSHASRLISCIVVAALHHIYGLHFYAWRAYQMMVILTKKRNISRFVHIMCITAISHNTLLTYVYFHPLSEHLACLELCTIWWNYRYTSYKYTLWKMWKIWAYKKRKVGVKLLYPSISNDLWSYYYAGNIRYGCTLFCCGPFIHLYLRPLSLDSSEDCLPLYGGSIKLRR